MLVKNKEILRFEINLVFAIYNCVLGIASNEVWFLAVGAYYIVLSVMRISVIAFVARNKENVNFIKKFTGVMLFVLSCVLCVIVYLTVGDMGATKYHEIAMITIALYAFTKLTLAIMGFVKARKNRRPYESVLRSITFTDAVVSIYSLQRSMLVTFEGMSKNEIMIFNILSGIGMCIIVVCTGLSLLRKE